MGHAETPGQFRQPLVKRPQLGGGCESIKDLQQAAALIDCLFDAGRGEDFTAAWEDTMARDKGWIKRLTQGWDALEAMATEVAARHTAS